MRGDAGGRKTPAGVFRVSGKHLLRRVGTIAMSLIVLMGASVAYAQSSMSVSVTPPLMQLTIGPGESWSSSLKIINSNSYDVTYYATVVDFEATGEEGQGTLIPLSSDASSTADSFSLGSWITLDRAPITIQAGKTGAVPFTVRVPLNAEPGGHYAAILVGTQPGNTELTGPTMKVSSYVSSLILVKIRGETVEQGRIREFRTEKAWSDTADANIILRFENTGNAHLHPSGDITIYNMWGKERGTIAVNGEGGNFGNVLPKSTRRFSFSWTGDTDLFDIGRYSAVVTLAYGDQGKQNTSAVTYFWVVPTTPVATTLGIIAAVIILFSWLIRRYVRRALVLEKERLGLSDSTRAAVVSALPATPQITAQVLLEPLREGVVDLRRMASGEAAPALSGTPERTTFLMFLRRYLLFFVFLALVFSLLVGGWWYTHRVLISSSNFRITDVNIAEEPVVTQDATLQGGGGR